MSGKAEMSSRVCLVGQCQEKNVHLYAPTRAGETLELRTKDGAELSGRISGTGVRALHSE